MNLLRNLCIFLGLLCMIGIYFGLMMGMIEVVVTLTLGVVLCAFMAVYCHGERYEE